ncbi:MAG: phage major capsid protein, partial [Gammaproteobacteria bacterium]|nr:phage major capsid protein [Gammaproteobacteria bacterium]
MPFTAQELADAGKHAIDLYLKNKPIDQISVERPFLRELMRKSKTFPGAKQYIIEQLRYTYGSNFQWYYGAQSVSYNARNTIEQTNWPWRSAHDGFFLDEDRLTQNGVILTDDNKGGKASRAEVMQLTNLLVEHTEVLRLGFEEG